MGPRLRDPREMWLAMARRVSTSGTVIFRTISVCSVQGVADTTGNAISIVTARAILSDGDTAALSITRRGGIVVIAVFMAGIDITAGDRRMAGDAVTDITGVKRTELIDA